MFFFLSSIVFFLKKFLAFEPPRFWHLRVLLEPSLLSHGAARVAQHVISFVLKINDYFVGNSDCLFPYLHVYLGDESDLEVPVLLSLGLDHSVRVLGRVNHGAPFINFRINIRFPA